MSQTNNIDVTKKSRAQDKLARIPIKIVNDKPALKKPDWIRVKLPSNPKVDELKQLFRKNKLVSVCEEASCPNLSECFSHGIATFMIMGDKCTRRCTFCDVGHGRPDPLDLNEPKHLADTIAQMQLTFIVITSVDRDDLRDGGAGHFANCIAAIREKSPTIEIEILVPDFRGRMDKALDALAAQPSDVFNHNIETVPRLYKQARPGSDYNWSLKLLEEHKRRFPDIPTKSGIMLGLGETDEEVLQVMQDLRDHNVNMITLGQYLQPSQYHIAVDRYVDPSQFVKFGDIAKKMGFTGIASGPLVRSSYHADLQAKGEAVN